MCFGCKFVALASWGLYNMFSVCRFSGFVNSDYVLVRDFGVVMLVGMLTFWVS